MATINIAHIKKSFLWCTLLTLIVRQYARSLKKYNNFNKKSNHFLKVTNIVYNFS